MKNVIVTAFLMFSYEAHAHGMDALGPNGGYIQMPGAYHVELVEKENLTQIYFLDMHFRALTTQGTSLLMNLKGAKNKDVTCVDKKKFYECNTTLKDTKNYDEVEIKTRLKKNGKLITSHYELPLKLE